MLENIKGNNMKMKKKMVQNLNKRCFIGDLIRYSHNIVFYCLNEKESGSIRGPNGIKLHYSIFAESCARVTIFCCCTCLSIQTLQTYKFFQTLLIQLINQA